ncbi:RcnB family protein [Erwinia sp. AnSW2-5]|uniref:RcnB family protein n=1 Tax=Erwinia sp. AnSW2-5 TaxID=3367692 RepID=UPI003859A3A4
MKKIATVALSFMIFASSSLSAFAQGPDNGPDQQQHKRPQQQHQQPPQKNQQQGHNAQPQHASQHQQRGGQQAGHQQKPDFRQGRALPPQYRGKGYQVSDWKKRGLKSPPSGHRWMNVDGNYVLIAVATGVIASVIAHQ